MVCILCIELLAPNEQILDHNILAFNDVKQILGHFSFLVGKNLWELIRRGHLGTRLVVDEGTIVAPSLFPRLWTSKAWSPDLVLLWHLSNSFQTPCCVCHGSKVC